ncbi:MAG: hypothetical protein WD552_00345 [Candidatus Paceibacterota bacterium]
MGTIQNIFVLIRQVNLSIGARTILITAGSEEEMEKLKEALNKTKSKLYIQFHVKEVKKNLSVEEIVTDLHMKKMEL